MNESSAQQREKQRTKPKVCHISAQPTDNGLNPFEIKQLIPTKQDCDFIFAGVCVAVTFSFSLCRPKSLFCRYVCVKLGDFKLADCCKQIPATQ